MRTSSQQPMIITILLLSSIFQRASSFVASPKICTTPRSYSRIVINAKTTPESSDDFLPDEELTEYTGSVDWDAEWKKVVAKGGVSTSSASSASDRPGKGYYKSEAEIAAIRAANKATVTVTEVASKVPTWDEAKGDWKIWVGVLAAISIGAALLTAQPELPTSNASPDSYYI